MLTQAELRTVLETIRMVAASGLQHLGAATFEQRPEMLTATEFAVAYKDVTAKTVERWCRDGAFPYATGGKRSSWRIPAFYLWADEPPAAMRHFFERAAAAESTEAAGASTPDRSDASPSPDAEGDASPSVSEDATSVPVADERDPHGILDYRKVLELAPDASESSGTRRSRASPGERAPREPVPV